MDIGYESRPQQPPFVLPEENQSEGVECFETSRNLQIASRKSFLRGLQSEEVINRALEDDQFFFKLLKDADDSNFVNYRRLAGGIGMKDPSSVSRWYNGKTAPEPHRRSFALAVLGMIIEEDIERMGNGKAPIGGVSVKPSEAKKYRLHLRRAG